MWPWNRRSCLLPACLSLLGLAILSGLAGCGGDDGPPHLVLVSVDTLRADHLGAYGAPPGLTPELDALAAESIVYERAFSPASHTLPSIAALLTGREPEEVGVISNRTVLPPGVPTLATRLWSGGYRTSGVVSSPILVRQSGVARGFDHYDARLPQREAIRQTPERIGSLTTDAALAALDGLLRDGTAERPFFLWVHYQDPHGPYTPPAAYAEGPRPHIEVADRPLPIGRDQSGVGQIPAYQAVDPDLDPEGYRAAYAGEVRYTSVEIGRLVAGLKQRGLWRRCVFVLTADHGEGLGEDDYWFAHGEYLSEPLVHVPLLLHAPGHEAGRRATPVSLVDVAPTLLALAGQPSEELAAGRDLLAPLPADRQVYQNALLGTLVPRLALIEGDWQYRISRIEGEREESLYRFGDLRDRAAEEPERMARLAEALRQRRDALRVDHEPRLRELHGEERGLLRALGYVFED